MRVGIGSRWTLTTFPKFRVDSSTLWIVLEIMKNTLVNEYAHATECGLATLEGLLMKKSSPKSEIRRQTSICLRELQVCREHREEIQWGHELHHNFPRVAEILADVPSVDLKTALEVWAYKVSK